MNPVNSPVQDAFIQSFTDWRVNVIDPTQSVVFPGQLRVNEHLIPYAQLLADHIKRYVAEQGDRQSFRLTVGQHRYRMQRVRSGLYAARKTPIETPRLTELGFRREQNDILLSEDLQRTGGLVVLFGQAGAGKTTTASGMVVSRLEKLGGFCMTVEDPPEHELEGFHGEHGYCEQMDASNIGLEQALVDALRCFPSGKQSMLLLGEVRSKAEAYELIQIALDGHLVITTMHAKDIVSGIIRLISLAGTNGEKEVRAMLASSLVIAAHQSLTNYTPHMNLLRFNPTASAIVQNGLLHTLQDEIQKQNRTAQPGRPNGILRKD